MQIKVLDENLQATREQNAKHQLKISELEMYIDTQNLKIQLTQKQLGVTQTDLSTVREKMCEAESQEDSCKHELQRANIQLDSAKKELQSAKAEIDLAVNQAANQAEKAAEECRAVLENRISQLTMETEQWKLHIKQSQQNRTQEKEEAYRADTDKNRLLRLELEQLK